MKSDKKMARAHTHTQYSLGCSESVWNVATAKTMLMISLPKLIVCECRWSLFALTIRFAPFSLSYVYSNFLVCKPAFYTSIELCIVLLLYSGKFDVWPLFVYNIQANSRSPDAIRSLTLFVFAIRFHPPSSFAPHFCRMILAGSFISLNLFHLFHCFGKQINPSEVKEHHLWIGTMWQVFHANSIRYDSFLPYSTYGGQPGIDQSSCECGAETTTSGWCFEYIERLFRIFFRHKL